MNLKETKKLIAVVLTACMLSSVPANAHQGADHDSHHSSNHGTYCIYHHKNHRNKSSCKKYCPLHKTTHSNGKKHSIYCTYHKKHHTAKSSCKKYCPVHKTTHSNGKKHHSHH